MTKETDSQNHNHWDMDKVLKLQMNHARLYMTSPFNFDQAQLRMHWLTILMRSAEASKEIIERNINKDLFITFNMLALRFVSHHQAIYDLLLNGRYGEVHALQRMLLEVTDLMTFFALYPDEVGKWRQWSAVDPLVDPKTYRKGCNEYSQANISKRIKEKGEEPASIEYQRLSAAVHPGEWGTDYYGYRNAGGKDFQLVFGPIFDLRWAFRLGTLANRALPYPIRAFLIMCKTSRAPKSVWRWTDSRYKESILNWQQEIELDSDFNEYFKEIEERVAAGEAMEKVLADITERIKQSIPSNITLPPSASH
ncbi:MAG: hypothetical protein TUN42_08965 [Dehalogenimonas sp.]